MDLKEDIRSITDLKIRPAAILSAVNKHRRPTIITQKGRARAVVQDIASYEANRKALLLLKLIAQSETEIQRGRVVKQQDLFDRLRKNLPPSRA